MTELATPPMAHEAPLAYAAQQVEDAAQQVEDAVMAASSACAGGIDEGGFLRNLAKKGFTQNQCWSELISNCIDASATKCYIVIDNNEIKLIDNGHGMDLPALKNMFQIYRENHPNQKTIGLSGIGAKAALYLLSKQKMCEVHTKKEGGNYLKARIPWENIMQQGKWTDMIETSLLTEGEKEVFNRERDDRHLDTKGCTVKIPYTDSIVTYLSNQFNEITKMAIQPTERFDMIFTHASNFELIFTHSDHPLEQQGLDMFRPLSLNNAEYYGGKTRYNICVYKDSNTNEIYFVLEDDNGQIYCRKNRRGVDKKPKPYTLTRPIMIGEMNYILGMKKDNNYFNPQQPTMPTCNALRLNDYELRFFPSQQGDVSHKEFLCEMPIIRNGHMIGTSPLVKFSSFNGGGQGQIKNKHKNFYIKQYLEYDTFARNNNPMDDIFGIQENKNQFNGMHLPKTLTYLLAYCKTKKAAKMWEYFTQLSDAAAAAVPVPDPVHDPAPDPAPDPVPDPAPDPVPDPAPDPVPDLAPDPVPDLAPDPVPDPTPAPDPPPSTPSPDPPTPPPVPLPPVPPSPLNEIIGTLSLANEETCDPSNDIIPRILELVRLLQIPNFADALP